MLALALRYPMGGRRSRHPGLGLSCQCIKNGIQEGKDAKEANFTKKSRKGGGSRPPYQKYLVIAAVCLIFLVLITDHFFKGKTKDLLKIPLPERGAITKEVPKQPEQSGA